MSVPSRVFVSGASGFIGRSLVERYRSLGSEVVGVDAALGEPEQGLVPGDITEHGDWTRSLDGCDLVVHTAAIVANAVPYETTWRVNVLGTRRLVEAAARAGVPRFVHFSSVRAYSDLDFPDGVDETWPVRTDGHRYVDTKIASEQVVLQAHAAGETAATVVRPGDVYGPRSIPWTIWPVTGIPNGTFVVPVEGGIFSPVYVDNLVDGVVLAAGDAGVGGVFNLCDGAGVTNEEFFGHYASMLGCDLPTAPASEIAVVLEAAGIGGDTVDYLRRTGTYSIAAARRVLGYEPSADLAEGMRQTEKWLREAGLLPS